MNCNKCGTPNDDGSKFCKECGQRLPGQPASANLSSDQHLKIGEFIYQAYKESEAGNLDKAVQACYGALAINDANHATHALLGSLYERKGDLPRAIFEYERVVSLNPGSLDDRRKLEQLRAQLLAPVSSVPAPSRRASRFDLVWLHDPKVRPAIAAAATFLVVVIVVGSLILRGGSAKQSEADTRQQAPTGQTQALPGQPAPYGLNPGQTGMAQQTGVPQTMPQTSREDTETEPPGSSSSSTRQTRPGIAPVPLPGGASGSKQSSPRNSQPATVEQPVIVPITRPRTSAPLSTTPSNGGSSSSPLVVSTPTPPGRSPEQRGMDLHRMGKYDEAIGAYREALNQTSDPGRVYQNMARSYQRKGDHDAAINSYNQAIKAYRDQLSSGRSRSEVENGIRACEAGIEVSRNQK